MVERAWERGTYDQQDGTRMGPVGPRCPGLRVMTDSRLAGSRSRRDMRVTTDSIGRRSRTICSPKWQFGPQRPIGAPRTEPLVTHGRVTGRPAELTRPARRVAIAAVTRIARGSVAVSPRPDRNPWPRASDGVHGNRGVRRAQRPKVAAGRPAPSMGLPVDVAVWLAQDRLPDPRIVERARLSTSGLQAGANRVPRIGVRPQ